MGRRRLEGSAPVEGGGGWRRRGLGGRAACRIPTPRSGAWPAVDAALPACRALSLFPDCRLLPGPAAVRPGRGRSGPLWRAAFRTARPRFGRRPNAPRGSRERPESSAGMPWPRLFIPPAARRPRRPRPRPCSAGNGQGPLSLTGPQRAASRQGRSPRPPPRLPPAWAAGRMPRIRLPSPPRPTAGTAHGRCRTGPGTCPPCSPPRRRSTWA